MYYPWYAYVTLGVIMSASYLATIYIPIGWRRNIYMFVPIAMLFISMYMFLISVSHAVRAGTLKLGYFEVPGMPAEIEFFTLGMVAAYILWLPIWCRDFLRSRRST